MCKQLLHRSVLSPNVARCFSFSTEFRDERADRLLPIRCCCFARGHHRALSGIQRNHASEAKLIMPIILFGVSLPRQSSRGNVRDWRREGASICRFLMRVERDGVRAASASARSEADSLQATAVDHHGHPSPPLSSTTDLYPDRRSVCVHASRTEALSCLYRRATRSSLGDCFSLPPPRRRVPRLERCTFTGRIPRRIIRNINLSEKITENNLNIFINIIM